MPFSLSRRLRLTSLSRIATAMGLGGLLLTVCVLVGAAWLDHGRRFSAAKREARTEAFFLADHASRLFENSQAILQAASAIVGSQDWDAVSGSDAVHNQLRILAGASPYLEDVWLNDTQGVLRATSFAYPAPYSNASDRESFAEARRPGLNLFVGPRIVGKVTGKPTFLISRRLESNDHAFRGMASVTADLSYFEDYWKRVRLPYDAHVTLLRAENASVLASLSGRPGDADVAARIPLQSLTQDSGDYGDGRRFGAFQRVGTLPLFLTVDIANEAVEAEWLRWVAAALAPAGALVIAALSLLTVMARRQGRIETEAAASLQASNARLLAEMATREEAEEQVRQLQKMEAIGQLSGGLAHDLNNMLAIIMGSHNLIRRRLERGETDVERYLNNADEGAQRAASLTRRLLAFARRQPLSPQVIDVNRFVKGLADLVARTLTEIIKVETVLGAGLWRVQVDPSQLENAIINLAVNARDAMPEGGRLTIETENASLDDAYSAGHPGIPAGQYVLVAVTDTGHGMAPDVAAKAFDPFFTTKAVGRGTGLGLSQVYGFVRQSGGHVKIYSEVGQGTTVKVYLPRHYGHPAEEAPLPRAVPLSETGSETILVVEDDDIVRTTAVETLRDLGYRVVHAANGTAALSHLDRNPDIGLLFTDVMMPDMNGCKLVEAALVTRPDLKVLYTSGYTRNAIVHNGILDAGVRLLPKPYGAADLARRIREALDG